MTRNAGRAPSAASITVRLDAELEAAADAARFAFAGDGERTLRELRRSRVTPLALTVDCSEHRVAAGAACFGLAGARGSGVCLTRVRAALQGGAS